MINKETRHKVYMKYQRLKDIIRFATDYLGIKLYWYQAVILYMVELRLV